jgi:multidrug resistance efflux pump
VTRRALLAVPALVASACGAPGEAPARVAEVKRQDLVVDVEVTGALEALDADRMSPPAIPFFWDFRITRMAAEGAAVQAGEEVVAFDTSELEKRLRDYENEVAALTEEIGKGRAEAALAALDDRLEAEQKEAEARKAELKADKPRDIVADLKRRQAELDRDLARREVELQRTKAQSHRLRERADLGSLRDRLARAQAFVDQTKASIAKMSLEAPRAGTVVYRQNWRGEKRKVGDQVYPGDSPLEVALLNRMGADGQVDEVDASKLRKGQRVGLRLEANPDAEHEGTVAAIAPLVRTESPESRVKVAQLEIALARTDAMMRPGMRFRGRIEVDRVPAVLQVPIAALHVGAGGLSVARVTGAGTEPVRVKVGRRSRDAIEITDGLREGDRVALAGGDRAAKGPAGGKP